MRVRWYEFGWPGSVGDNRIWKASPIYLNHRQFYSAGQYSISDSGMQSENSNVSMFRKSYNGVEIEGPTKHFNNIMTKPRALSEHFNGRWKGRFQCMKELRTMIGKDGKPEQDMQRIHKIILATLILHNMTADQDDLFTCKHALAKNIVHLLCNLHVHMVFRLCTSSAANIVNFILESLITEEVNECVALAIICNSRSNFSTVINE